MVDIIKSIIDLLTQFINGIFNFQVEFIPGQNVAIGVIVVSFVFFVLSIYLILRALGIIKEGSDE